MSVHDDIVERLRRRLSPDGGTRVDHIEQDLRDAVAEIERLRVECERRETERPS